MTASIQENRDQSLGALPGDAFSPRFRASHRAVLRRLGLSASIAIALSGCKPDRAEPKQEAVDTCAVEATPIAYSTVAAVADSKLSGHGLAQGALTDGFLSECEYEVIMHVRQLFREDEYRADKERAKEKWKRQPASAIEAATAAETAQTGSVHESATAKPGRPESGQ